MKEMSVGMPSTLENWHKMSKSLFGPDSRATAFLQKKIDEQGPQEEVIADEAQLIQVLVLIHLTGPEPENEAILSKVDQKAAERLQEHRNLASQPMEDRDGYESAAMYAKERKEREGQ